MHILLIEDDRLIQESLQEALEMEGHEVEIAGTLQVARRIYDTHDLLILDISLPDGNGVEFCKEIRQFSQVPILFLTARDDEETIVAGLHAGGDDYMTKPFGIRELYARIHAITRRKQVLASVIYSGDLEIHQEEYKVYKQGQEITFTSIGYEILFVLASSHGRVVTRDYLLEFIESKTGNYIEDNTLSVHIKRVREKIGTYKGMSYIETIRGIGYRWKN